jgi:hypothetical protein
MKKLHLDYALSQMLQQKLGDNKFRIFLNKYEYIISADKKTEDFLKNFYYRVDNEQSNGRI